MLDWRVDLAWLSLNLELSEELFPLDLEAPVSELSASSEDFKVLFELELNPDVAEIVEDEDETWREMMLEEMFDWDFDAEGRDIIEVETGLELANWEDDFERDGDPDGFKLSLETLLDSDLIEVCELIRALLEDGFEAERETPCEVLGSVTTTELDDFETMWDLEVVVEWTWLVVATLVAPLDLTSVREELSEDFDGLLDERLDESLEWLSGPLDDSNDFTEDVGTFELPVTADEEGKAFELEVEALRVVLE